MRARVRAARVHDEGNAPPAALRGWNAPERPAALRGWRCVMQLVLVAVVLGLALPPQVAASSADGVAWATRGYPTFADMGGQPYTVSYDKRSLQIAGQPALFLSGAIHPPRGTPEMWSGWLEHAKANHLNMVQVYIFWK